MTPKYRLVPEEPTREMLDAAQNSRPYTEEDGPDWRNSANTWDAMIKASPPMDYISGEELASMKQALAHAEARVSELQTWILNQVYHPRTCPAYGEKGTNEEQFCKCGLYKLRSQAFNDVARAALKEPK